MKYLKDWKVFAFCFGMVVASELIGAKAFKFGKIGFTLLPMLYALILGIILFKAKLINREMMVTASPYITISVMLLTAKMGSSIGPNLSQLFSAGPALLGQFVLKKVLFIFISVPVGVWLFKMGRQVVGCGFSTNREDAIAIVGNLYGLDSPEGQGVMGGYITGTLFGTIFMGLLASFTCSLGIFTPQALAIGASVGSASMMSAALAVTLETFPELSGELQTLTAAGQIVGSVIGLYVTLFMALPLTDFLYKRIAKEPAAAEKGGK